jgi:8-oxo-dGTP pyrophosphatase MutT (NUDIX family)
MAPAADAGAPPPQRIPRPVDFQAGAPSPWAGLPPSRRTGLTLARVRAAFADPVALDGAAAGGRERQAAVLVALFEEEGEARVVLTRRAATLRSHTGEVSFPGGQAEPGEALVDAARRESWEEVALPPESVEVIGALGSLRTVSSSALITPFVGLLPERPALTANPVEVERAFDVALADLLVDGVHHSEVWRRGEIEIELQFFDLATDIVWGATARVLTELLILLNGVSAAAPWLGEVRP